MLKHCIINSNKGFSAILVALLVLGSIFVAIVGLAFVSVFEQKINRNYVLSAQAYYASESGIEDGLYRIVKNKPFAASSTLAIGNSSAVIQITGSNSQKMIYSSGQQINRVRNVLTSINLDTSDVSFYYGVQVGEGGLVMSNNTTVSGNVYSNGSIQGGNGALITGEAWVAGNHYLDNIDIGSHAHAHTITGCDISGDAYYQTISSSNVAGVLHPNSPDPDSEPLPISDSQINNWKTQAAEGGIINDNYVLTNFAVGSLGPKKINGNLTISNGADLTVTGTIYVTGTITISNNAKVRLGAAYGALSGMIITDNFVSVSNNAVFYTNGAGSYLMVLSTKTGDAVSVANNSNTVIFYASAGNVTISNNANLKEVTAYKITINNNAIVNYESGLASAKFSSGAGAGWIVDSWKEVE